MRARRDRAESDGSSATGVTRTLSEAVAMIDRYGVGGGLRKGLRFAILRGRLEAYNATGGYRVRVDGRSASFELSSVWEVVALEYIESEERAVVGRLLDELDQDDVFWDVGAHVGVHTCLCGKQARAVVAVEPYPPNLERLRTNVARNGVDCTIIEGALGDEETTGTIHVPAVERPGNQWAALSSGVGSTSDRRVSVPVRTGDALLETDEVPAPDVVKVDVEGASVEVLKGLERTLRRDACRAVIVEVHRRNAERQSRPGIEDFGHDPQTVVKLLAEYGFDVETLLERESDHFLWATKATAGGDDSR